jgi:hypothetical protein
MSPTRALILKYTYTFPVSGPSPQDFSFPFRKESGQKRFLDFMKRCVTFRCIYILSLVVTVETSLLALHWKSDARQLPTASDVAFEEKGEGREKC